MNEFRVELDVFRGPLDLLLYLVRKHELEVAELPLACIAQQYLDFLEVLREIDVNAVGDFLEIAAVLVEMKSRLVLPHAEDAEAVWDEPAQEIVQRLLEYKRFRDAASMLEDQGRQWQQRYPRQANDSPPRRPDVASQPIHEVELWDLVSAFGRIIRDSAAVQPSSIVYDDTPIQVYMSRIHRRLSERGQLALSELFTTGMHKSAMIGVFLAILELVRHHHVVTEQPDLHGEILIRAGEDFASSPTMVAAAEEVSSAPAGGGQDDDSTTPRQPR